MRKLERIARILANRSKPTMDYMLYAVSKPGEKINSMVMRERMIEKYPYYAGCLPEIGQRMRRRPFMFRPISVVRVDHYELMVFEVLDIRKIYGSAIFDEGGELRPEFCA